MVGKVQGVFFRASAKDQAVMLGVSGFVQNEEDGSVYLLAEGEKEKLDALVNWCHHGPPRSEVEKVIVKESEPEGFVNFIIKR